MITITLNKIKAHASCQDRWQKLLNHLGKTEADDEEFSLADVLDSNGLDDALWCLRCLPEHDKKWRLLAVKFARQVQHLMEDKRSFEALDVAEKYAKSEATDKELRDAWTAARGAAWSGAGAAFWAARAAAWSAAGYAAWYAVFWAALAVRDARNSRNAREKQKQLFLKAIEC